MTIIRIDAARRVSGYHRSMTRVSPTDSNAYPCRASPNRPRL